jgi:hypothetical protein
MNEISLTYKNIKKSLSVFSPQDSEDILLKTQILLELFLNDLNISSESYHSFVLQNFDRLGFLEKYLEVKNTYHENVKNICKKELQIDSYENFSKSITEDESYRTFIYDLIKDKLLE